MKKVMSIAAVALMIAGSTAIAGDANGCKGKKAECKKSNQLGMYCRERQCRVCQASRSQEMYCRLHQEGGCLEIHRYHFNIQQSPSKRRGFSVFHWRTLGGSVPASSALRAQEAPVQLSLRHEPLSKIL